MKIGKAILAGIVLLCGTSLFAQNPWLSQKHDWKVYRGLNGEKFKIEMDTVRQTSLGVLVWGGEVGVDIISQPILFDCHGYFLIPGEDEGDSPLSGEWMLAPSRSVIGAIAKDVCAQQKLQETTVKHSAERNGN